MAERVRVPGAVVAFLLGVAGALPMLGLCLATASVLAQQVLVGGSPADWAVPAVATMLTVLGSLGPVGFFNETAQGAVGIGIETALLPWAMIAATPMTLLARSVGTGRSASRLAELAFAVGYGIAAGVGAGSFATWAVAAEPGLDLPVSPDLVAARSTLIALVAIGLVRLPARLGRMVAVARPVVVGGLALVLGTIAMWLGGLLITIVQVPTEARQGVTTAGSIAGANLSAASFYASLGADTELSVGSGLTGEVDSYTIAEVAGLTDAGVALIGTLLAVLVIAAAVQLSLRRAPDTLPPIATAFGVALGFAGTGAAIAALISGGFDLLILPTEGTARTFAEVTLDIGVADVFTVLGARAIFVALPLLLLHDRRTASSGALRTPTVTAEPMRVGYDV